MSPNFINLPYTKEGVVGLGWGIVKDFTNMFFIVILVFIGLATALRIREYEAKKTLPLLILIALLINFTPVICGAIIDASNIIMNFFLDKLSSTNLLEQQLKIQGDMIRGELNALTLIDPFKQLSLILKSCVLIAFNFIATFIFFAFSLLFAMRYIAIWVLVILSPLAFFSYILPATRKLWTTWWNQFIQWATIGITGAFFLYLGLQSLTILSDTKIYSTPPPPGLNFLEPAGLNFINEMLPYGVAIAFLILSFFMGLSTGAMGGSQIIGLAKTSGAAAGKWAGGRSYNATLGRLLASQARERAPGEKPSFLQKMASTTWKNATPGERAGSLLMGGTWAARKLSQLGLQAGAGNREARRGEIDAAEKKVTGQAAGSQLTAFRATGALDTDKIGYLNAMIKDKNIDAARDKTQFGNLAITDGELTELYRAAQSKYNKHSILRSAFPDIAANNLPPGTTVPTGVPYATLHAVLEKIKAADYENISRRTLNNNDFVDAVINKGMPEHISRLVAAHQKAASDRLEERLRALTATLHKTTPDKVNLGQMKDYLEKNNRRLHQYITKRGGGLMGI